MSFMSNGVFTLPDTDTADDSETDKLQQYSITLLSQCSMNTSKQFHTTNFFIGVCVGVCVGQCEHSIRIYPHRASEAMSASVATKNAGQW